MPIWMIDDTLVSPIGNFSTYGCNDGTISDCEELDLNNIFLWFIAQTDSLNRDFLRIKSR